MYNPDQTEEETQKSLGIHPEMIQPYLAHDLSMFPDTNMCGENDSLEKFHSNEFKFKGIANAENLYNRVQDFENSLSACVLYNDKHIVHTLAQKNAIKVKLDEIKNSCKELAGLFNALEEVK